MPKAFTPPTYRRHKPTGQAVVTVRLTDGTRKDLYLGPYGSAVSHAEYSRVVAELAVSHGRLAPTSVAALDITVSELLLLFKRHAEEHYRHPDGTPTSELNNFAMSLRFVRELYGRIPALEFGPLALKAVRQKMIDVGWCRTQINGRVGRIKRVWKWAVENQIVPPATFQALVSVAGLQRGRSGAKEREPVKPVEEEVVDATTPYLGKHVRGLVELQRLTGCRPGEACSIRRSDIDMSTAVWLYRPLQHKLAYRGKRRVIAIGPKAQALLREFFTPNLNDFLFSPRRAVDEFHASRALARKTPRYPSHDTANKQKRSSRPRRTPAEKYQVLSYGRAIARGVERANAAGNAAADGEGEEFRPIPHWHPNQLRHSHGTAIRKRFGLEAAQVILGHAKANVTEVYAERDEALAVRVASEVG
jgi:integrase